MRLTDFYDTSGPERAGIIKKDGSVIELENRSSSPMTSFSIDPDQMKDATATWHTHPNKSANLSVADMQAFLAWPNLDHYIVGNDAILLFFVEDDVVILSDETGFTWQPSGNRTACR